MTTSKGQLKQLDKVINRELEAIPQTLTTVKGLGPVSAAGIIAEIGSIKRFKDQAALAQYADSLGHVASQAISVPKNAV